MKKQTAKRAVLQLTYTELALAALVLIGIGVLLQAGLANFLIRSFFEQTPQTRIITVGPQNDALSQTLQSEDFRLAGIQYGANLNPDYVVPGVLDKSDAVIVSQTPYCSQALRTELTRVIQQGHTMLLIGDSCTKDANDPSINGWYGGTDDLGPLMPARLVNDANNQHQQIINDQFKILAVDHPIFNGIKNFYYSGTITTAVANNAEILAVFGDRSIDAPNAQYTPAMLEKDQANGGKAIWASFDVTNIQDGGSRNMLLNLLLYTEKTTHGLQVNLNYQR